MVGWNTPRKLNLKLQAAAAAAAAGGGASKQAAAAAAAAAAAGGAGGGGAAAAARQQHTQRNTKSQNRFKNSNMGPKNGESSGSWTK